MDTSPLVSRKGRRRDPRRGLYQTAIILLFANSLCFARTSSDLVARIGQLNQQIEMQQQGGIFSPLAAIPAPMTKVLAVRNTLVEELIRTQPAAIRSVMLDNQVAARLRSTIPVSPRF